MSVRIGTSGSLPGAHTLLLLILHFTWMLKLALAVMWQVDSVLPYTGNFVFHLLHIVCCAFLGPVFRDFSPIFMELFH